MSAIMNYNLIADFVAYASKGIKAVSKFEGGWEVWAQVEFAVFCEKQKNIQITREHRVYANSNSEADFVFPDQTIVELKCKTEKETEQRFAERMKKEIAKLQDVRTDYKNTPKWIVGLSAPDAVTFHLVNEALNCTESKIVPLEMKKKTGGRFCHARGADTVSIWWWAIDP